jgi:hypothetical protein
MTAAPAPAPQRTLPDRTAERAAAREAARQAARDANREAGGPMTLPRQSANDPPPFALPSRGPAQPPALDFGPRRQRGSGASAVQGSERSGFDSMPVQNTR